MGYQAVFDGWDSLTLADLLVAYRKAKADCYFENTFPSAINFAEYEQDLLAKLGRLLKKLQKEQGFSGEEEWLGKYRILPKKLTVKPLKDAANGHIHFSCPKRAFENLVENNELTPEFRIVGDFPVDAHIISALWINTVGHKFDACLNKSCYGARLRRIRNDESLDKDAARPFHISAIGSFIPYFQPYQLWRNDGLKAIRDELEKDREVIAVSLDLKSYYHYIDPQVLASKELQAELGLVGDDGLSPEEQQFTEELAKFLSNWSIGAKAFSTKVSARNSKVSGGLAIGLTASRVISNVLLHRWDKLIKEQITPIHYGRYVDDMFLVMHDTGLINNTNDFMEFLEKRLGSTCISREKPSKSDSLWKIELGKEIQGDTQIRLQAEKQKLFVLKGQAGLDLMDSIEKEICELSSEHRLMISPDQLEDSTAARVLSAAGSVGEHADTLRRADGLTIRRLSWSLQLRHVETLARDLPAKEWIKQREEFYQFAHDHILRPDGIFEHFNYLPRLLGFAISLNEWAQAEQIVKQSFASLDLLEKRVSVGKGIGLNGVSVKAGAKLWQYVKSTLSWMFIDAAARHYDPDRLLKDERPKKETLLAELFFKGIFAQLESIKDFLTIDFVAGEFYTKAPLIAMADLAKEPYKRILSSSSAPALLSKRSSSSVKERKVINEFIASELIDVEVLKKFLSSTLETRLNTVKKGERKGESKLPYLFPTRPYTPDEIAELAPECIWLNTSGDKADNPAVIWAKYTQAIRGVWVKPTLLAVEQDRVDSSKDRPEKKRFFIGTEHKKKIVVALTNIKTSDEDWAAMACNKANLSLDRYGRIAELVNQTIRLKPKPDYVLFPELCLPIEWVKSISARLSDVGISLIAGTEYRHYGQEEVVSEACLVLTDNRLGFPASVKIWQPKLEPAVGEDHVLTSKYGKHWAAKGRLSPHLKKPIYVHNGVHFGVMVCSELQNSKARVRFQGEIDALMVLSWNQDLETFSSLIESAALDVHAYTILVNNRLYGDSRVRSPAKETFMRDLARVRGGDNDFVVAVTLDVEALRAFQSRAKRWPQKGDKFKPLPEGFKLHPKRKKLPPS